MFVALFVSLSYHLLVLATIFSCTHDGEYRRFAFPGIVKVLLSRHLPLPSRHYPTLIVDIQPTLLCSLPLTTLLAPWSSYRRIPE